MRIGVIGLGHMGAPIAQNLVKAGHEVIVYNRTRERSAVKKRRKGRSMNRVKASSRAKSASAAKSREL